METKARITLALTGATGFIGSSVLDAALAKGMCVRALGRRHQSSRQNLEWVVGDVVDVAALTSLFSGVDVVFHAAGVIKAKRREDFIAINRDGVRNAIDAALSAGVKHFVLVSSLAAREPHLSPYAFSKKAGEDALKNLRSNMSWTILRPPAVYGPRDREILRLFRMMKWGFAPTAGAGHRFSLMHVSDFAQYGLALLSAKHAENFTVEPDDGKTGGYRMHEVAQVAASLLARPVRVVTIPELFLKTIAVLNQITAPLIGATPMMTYGKINEFQHPNWVSSGLAQHCPPGFRVKFSLSKGMQHSFAWYKNQGWL